jgi:dihydroorotase
MTILVRKALVKDSQSVHHNKVCDILIKDGIITEITNSIKTNADKVIEFVGQCISPGWVDIFANGTDPGFEHRDTLESYSHSAASGGYTHVFLSPNTKPVVQNKSNVEYVKNHSVSFPVSFHPIGAVTKNTDGKELSEMYELHQAGAPAFSDGVKPIQSAGLMIKALQYIKAFNGILIQIPDETSISSSGQMNEGVISTQIGLKGKHKIAETIMVTRDIELASYAKSKLHITGITTSESVLLISNSKKNNAGLTCSVTPQHLFFSELELHNYDTNLKMNPPLRSDEERMALIDAVRKGLIDCIATHHTPQDVDMKLCEFEYAGEGMLCLESSFGMLVKLGFDLDLILNLISTNPRKIFNLPSTIAVGNVADITIFDPNREYEFTASNIKSKSLNSPLNGKQLKGIVIATILGEKYNVN